MADFSSFDVRDSSLKVKIPEGILKEMGYVLKDSRLKEGVAGHISCYEKIGVFSRHSHIDLTCYNCSSFHSEWVDGDEVLEKCYKWKKEEPGHQGVIGFNPICNFFGPNYSMKTKEEYKNERSMWNKLRPSIEASTREGFENLIVLLEKAKLVEKIK